MLSQSSVLDLSECSDYRLALQGRPPRIVHGTALALVALLVVSVVWLMLTDASLVVRAGGRVRATTTPTRVFTGVASNVEGRVVEVHCEPGDEVAAGAVLLRLDTERLENEILKTSRGIAAGEEALVKLERLTALAERRFDAARAKIESEIGVAEQGVRRAEEQREAGLRLAELEAAAAQTKLAVVRQLAEAGSTARRGLEESELRAARATARLHEAALSIDDGGIEVLQRAMTLLGREHEVELEKLEVQRIAARRSVEAARRELADLEMQRERAVLRAPIAGVVTRGRIAVGDVLEPGRAVVEIVPRGGFTFEVAVPTEDVAHLRVGMPARIKLDAFDAQRYGALAGVVRYISPDSMALEAPMAGRGAVYVVKIELSERRFALGSFAGEARLGMAGCAEIITGTESLMLLLLRRIRGTVSLG